MGAVASTCNCCAQPNGYVPTAVDDPNDYIVVRDPNAPSLPVDAKRSLHQRDRKKPSQSPPAPPAPKAPLLTAHTLAPMVVPTRDELNLRRFKAIEYLQRSTASSFDCVIERFQKMGGRIAPAVFFDATVDGAFFIRTTSADASSAPDVPVSPAAADEVPVTAKPSGARMFQLSECLRTALDAATSGTESFCPMTVVPICHDGASRSQVCFQALKLLQSQGQLPFEISAPHGMLHSVDPFVAPALSYVQFIASAEPDFERETAWKYHSLTSQATRERDEELDRCFSAAFGTSRTPRFCEAALAAESACSIAELGTRLESRDVDFALSVRSKADSAIYQQTLLKSPPAALAARLAGSRPANMPVTVLALAFNRSVHALLFRLLEVALRTRTSLRHIVIQPLMMSDPLPMSVTLGSDAPLRNSRDCLAGVFRAALAEA
jgi:hypothetical protein